MPTYQAPLASTLFLLRDVLGYSRYANLPGFADAPLDTVETLLGQAARFCEEVVQPLNGSGDREGCTRHPDGSVTTPEGFKEAYRQFAEAGWVGLSADPDHGGQGLPAVLAAALNEFVTSANMAWGMYPGLTQGAIAALTRHGSDAQKALYLPKLASGRWSGTMNLTEPQCGTDLGLIRTAASPSGDGSYRLTGQKIFISAGEHDLTENIVHLVLARIEGSPEGTKGLSLFVAPKFLPDPAGEPGGRNGLSCGSIERKMGIHGNATCVMNYDGATAWLVGEADKGLRAMFTMMNEARLGVAVQGLALSEAAYQAAVAYAKDRRQGRALSGAAEPAERADPILVHPDIRRTLLEIRAFNEAARALVLWTALKGDLAARSPDAAELQAADDAMGLMTPILKGVLTDRGFANTVAAQQVFGGHGYIVETRVEQFVRDARIAMLYEGANGIQALDLVGRKLPKDAGRAVTAYFAEVATFLEEAGDDQHLNALAGPLKASLGHLQSATMWFMANALKTPDNAGAGATDYMHLFGLVALGHMWGLMARAAHARLADLPEDADSLHRVRLARIFAERLLPETAAHLARIQAGASALMDAPAEAF